MINKEREYYAYRKTEAVISSVKGSKENASYTLLWKHSGEDRLHGGSGGNKWDTARESEKEYESKVK